MKTLSSALAALALLLALPGAASAQTMDCGGVHSDNFNRANSTDLGAGWVETGTDLAISSQRLTNPAASAGFAQAVGVTGQAMCMDVVAAPSGQVSYAAAALNVANANQNVFIRFQDGDADGLFDSVSYLQGNNGTAWTSGSTPAPFASARIRVAVVGSQLQLDIDTDFDQQPNSGSGRSNVPAAGGTGVGLGASGNATIDNFTTAPVPDRDADGVMDGFDLCPDDPSQDPTNTDQDSAPDVCDEDDDGDGLDDAADACPLVRPTVDANGDGCPDASSANPNTAVTGKPVFRGRGKGKKGRRGKKRYVFTFHADVPGVTFRCSLDGGAFEPCASPAVYTGLRPGRHTFTVKSVDASGVESAPQSTSIRVKKPRRR